jgi:PAS domain S-box-containing protein
MERQPVQILLFTEDTELADRVDAMVRESGRPGASAGSLESMERLEDKLGGAAPSRSRDTPVVLLDLGDGTCSVDDVEHVTQEIGAPTLALTEGEDEGPREREALERGAQDVLRREEDRSAVLLRAARHARERHSLRNQVRDQASLLESTLEAVTEGVLVVDLDGNVDLCNQRFQSIWGLSDELVASGDDDALLEAEAEQLADPDAFLEGVEELYDNPAETSFDLLEFADGRVIERYSRPRRLEGEIVGRVWTFRDVTERERTEEALRESEERFRTLYENATIGLYRTTPDGEIAMANPALVEMLGYDSFEELSDHDLEEDAYHPVHSREEWRRRVEEEDVVRGVETTWETRDGDEIRIRESARAVRDEDGEVRYYEGTLEDVTDRWRAEQDLARRNELLTALHEVSLQILGELDVDGVLEEIVERTSDLVGTNLGWIFLREEVEDGPDHLELQYTTRAMDEYQGLDLERGEGHGGTVWQEGGPVVIEAYDDWDHQAPDFPAGVLGCVAGVPLTRGGELVGVLGVSHPETGEGFHEEEITALERLAALASVALANAGLVDDMEAEIRRRRQTQEELERSQERLRDAQRVAQVGSWEWHVPTDTVRWSDEQYRSFGLEPGEVQDLGYEDFLDRVHPSDRDRVEDRIREALETGTHPTFEFRVQHPDGTVRWMEERGDVEVEDGEVVRVRATTLDITDRVIPHRRYRALVESTPDAVVQVDQEGDIVGWNEAAEGMFGYPEEEILGNPVRRILGDPVRRVIADRYVDEHGERLERIEENEDLLDADAPIEIRGVRADGSEFPAEVALDTYQLGDETFVSGIWRDVTERKEAQEALRESEERYRTLVNAAPDAIYTVNLDGTIESLNPAFEDLTGWSPEEWEGRSFEDLVHPDDLDHAWEKIAEIREGRDPLEAELRFRTQDGGVIHAHVVGSPRVVDGEIEGLIGIGRDITDRKASKRALQERTRQLETLVSNLPGVVYRCRNRPGWPMSEVGGECRELTGYSREAIEEGDVSWGEDLVHPGDRAEVRTDVEEALAADEPFETVYRIRRADGAIRWVWERGRATGEAEDGTEILEGFITDITERKEAQEQLRRSEARYRNLVEAAPDVIYTMDEDGTLLTLNPAFEEVTGWAPGEWEGEHFSGLVPDEDIADTMEAYEALMDGEDVEFEIHFNTADGERIVGHVVCVPLEDEDGSRRILGVVRDVTDRKKAQEQLRRSEARYRRLVEGSPDAIFTLAPDGSFGSVNAAWTDTTGWTRAEIEDKALVDLVHEDDRDRAVRAFGRVLDGEREEAEFRVRTRDGSYVWGHGVGVPLYQDGEVDKVLGVVRDITERKAAEDRLRTVKNFNQTVLENAPVGIAHLAQDGSMTYQNRELRRLRGVEDADEDPLREVTIDEFDPVAEREELQDRIRSLLDEGEPFTEYQSAFETAQGEELHLAVTGVPIEADGGDVAGAILLARDVTEEKQLEREVERQTVKLIHSEKVAALGHLVAGIAHEINNPLSVTRSNTEIMVESTQRVLENPVLEEVMEGEPVDVGTLREEVVADEDLEFLYQEGPDLLARNLRNLERIGDFVDSLRTFATPDDRRTMEDLNGVLEDSVELFRAQFREEVDLRTSWGELPEVPCDGSQVGQVVMNLLLNAAQASPEGAPVTLRTRREDDRAVIEVEDEGEGIPAEEQDRILDPFYSTKEDDNMGLGLSITQNIVADHGGTIDVDSTPGEGALFRVRLPLEEGSA